MQIFLLQFREDAKMRDHEYFYFLKHSGLGEEEVDRVTAMECVPKIEEIKKYDALVLGGSGEYLVSSGDIPEVMEKVASLLREVRVQGMPILGICFGAHILAKVFGGEVINDETRAETGTFKLTKNQSAGFCPLLKDLPESFDAQFGHKDHVAKLPEGALNLASTQKSTVQVFTFPGEKIYGVGFHPELNRQAMYDRFEYYAEEYHLVGDVMEAIKKATWDTPIASKFIRLFLDKIVTQKMTYKADLEMKDVGCLPVRSPKGEGGLDVGAYGIRLF
ncbi:hypothetical protein CO057_01340 [Candidatus Uhrbacteria bacterium CG_4_9_14_0_2_um_filter_41_50]|uniref:Glutamine amidotransferase domain-containing protein n=1 Tax=Candidatus Uhrbacteria bacterium CG_4_9_14_0_2_um_filter_41_50 TaxID=1975031 RepID=A0A2M8EPS2_9BACT|nr:MAG: hypothetical protein COZ45_04000 [Candidatus Uhrbacteria bacterium CG_4_10_14_3_um_filter_41_21]PIZ55311.1 MAG: hypothetical protein COY24_00940 [Candidatus Uhrbacteria bacterium CG_4_10_14_0_2_um_filter_41_21]PJB84550.1 MAG: hypothetical protein CO086_03110 [Candidatus Uhrbacteria bacterium CG_4_9_14_0_8_um_filter_41_16]PJC24740.1 MAG: hypothetical protein CO057_01340 [Candidatus Uhrbacteria bacterium CG_4_9_14_0_2_um_filter_41_50]PJE74915.1 MAG: hypothetical protein COV03_03000 [Candi